IARGITKYQVNITVAYTTWILIVSSIHEDYERILRIGPPFFKFLMVDKLIVSRFPVFLYCIFNKSIIRTYAILKHNTGFGVFKHPYLLFRCQWSICQQSQTKNP